MSKNEFLITIIVLALSVQITRFLPFLFFKNKDKLPNIITFLGKVIPASMMGMLVIYCLKDFNLSNILAPIIASASVVIIHLYKHNTILSITIGTIIYMFLIRVI